MKANHSQETFNNIFVLKTETNYKCHNFLSERIVKIHILDVNANPIYCIRSCNSSLNSFNYNSPQYHLSTVLPAQFSFVIDLGCGKREVTVRKLGNNFSSNIIIISLFIKLQTGVQVLC